MLEETTAAGGAPRTVHREALRLVAWSAVVLVAGDAISHLVLHEEQHGTLLSVLVDGCFTLGALILLFLSARQILIDRDRCYEAAIVSEDRFRQAINQFPYGVYVLNNEGRVVYHNRFATRFFTQRATRPDGRLEKELLPVSAVAAAEEARQTVRQTRAAHTYDDHHPGRNGGLHLVKSYVPVLAPDGSVREIVVVVFDVTSIRAVNERLKRTNRLFDLQSAANRALVQARDRDVLLKDFGQILLQQGGFDFFLVARITSEGGLDNLCCLKREGAAKRIQPATVEEGQLSGLEPVIETGEIVVIRQPGEPENGSRTRPLLREHGLKSLVGLPFRIEQEIKGVFCVGSTTLEAFDEEEKALLTQLAADLGFGLAAEQVRHDLRRQIVATEISRAKLVNTQRLARLADWQLELPALKFTASPALHAVLGLEESEEALDVRQLWERVHPTDRNSLLRTYEAATRKGAVMYGTFRFQSDKPGAPNRVFKCHAEFTRRTDGDSVINGVLYDITDLAAAQEQIRLQTVALDSTANAIVITDRQGTIQWVNRAFTKITGYSFDEAVGQNPRILKSGKQPLSFYQRLWRTITDGKVWEGEFCNRRKDGSEYWEDAVISPVRADGRSITHFIAVKQDITREKQEEKAQLRSQRMESLGLLAGGIAHDLNNVLAPIMMGLPLLDDPNLPKADRSDIVQSIEAALERGAGIIRQVLTFARGSEGERIPLQCRHLLKDIVKMMKETFPKNISVELNAPSDLPVVTADPTQLHQVFLNLGVNARDAMPDGGSLRIRAESREIKEPRSYLNQKIEPGRYVAIEFTDTGTGIAPDDLDRIFEPFFTTKEEGKGTGLGLSTVIGIVRGFGGMVSVQSEPGKGSSFEILLPAAEAEAKSAEKKEKKLLKGRGETVLVVDDEPAILEVTQFILEKNGYRVVTAEDGADAIGVYSRDPASIDVVLTDIMMPHLDGVALVRALQKINPKVKIIASSGLVGEEKHRDKVAQLKALEIHSFLRKPYSAAELLTCLHERLTETE